MNGTKTLLSARQLKLYYPIRRGIVSRTVGSVKAVDGVDLDIYAGETLGLVGESGCGKSTLGRTLCRLEKPTDGKIVFDGKNIEALEQKNLYGLRTKLQIIFQDPYSSLNPRKRVVDILAEPLLVHHIVPQEQLGAEVDRLLDLVGLPKGCKHRYPHEFSGGQRQRIGIARALTVRPELIICDEPVSALDVSIQAQILNLLCDLQREMNLTYLFIAHGLGSVRYVSNRVAVMYLGKIVEIAPKDEIFAHPLHPYTKVLMEAYPVPNPHLRARSRTVLEGDVPSPANPPSGCRFHTRCPMATEECSRETPVLKGGVHRVACLKIDMQEEADESVV